METGPPILEEILDFGINIRDITFSTLVGQRCFGGGQGPQHSLSVFAKSPEVSSEAAEAACSGSGECIFLAKIYRPS